MYVRLCLSNGPGAVIIARETRKLRGRTKAVAVFRDPLAVDVPEIAPYECVSRYQLSWLVPARLVTGGGTYSVSSRVRDAYGKLSGATLFTLRL
jgi:hypothetical protein